MLSILNDMFPNRVWDAVEDWYIREGVHHPGDGERGPTPKTDPELEELHPLLCSVNGARLNPSTGGTMKMKRTLSWRVIPIQAGAVLRMAGLE